MNNYFRTNLIFLRQKNSKTLADIGLAVEKKGNTIGYWEKGDYEPNISEIGKIAQLFDISPVDLLYTDLANVHPTGLGDKNADVHQNVHPSVHLTPISHPDKELYRMPQVVTVDNQGNDNMILVPVKARAGYLSGYSDPEFISSLPAYRLPGFNNGTFRLFEVKGNSMAKGREGIHDRDIIIGSFVEDLNYVRDDRVHVVVTKEEGVVVKRVYNRVKTDNRLILQSDNYKARDQFPTIVCDPEDIMEIWYGVALITRHMPGNDDLAIRTIDLEGQFTILRDEFQKLKEKLTGNGRK